MKILFLRLLTSLAILLTGLSPLHAQSALPYVLASSGSTGTMPNGTTLNFTVGEPFTATIGSSPQFTQGFQQPSTSGNPLPVQWLDFSGTARNGHNYLGWRTAQEKNNDYFQVERSRDGLTFQIIGKVPSSAVNGNSSNELAYSYIDKDVPAGASYYRLKQVDKDKRFSYSKVIRLEHDVTGQFLSVSPNPTHGKVYLSIPRAGKASQAQVTDITGKYLKTVQLTSATTEIDLSGWASGVYFIKYTDGSVQELVKLVKD
jgi:hypothetical protein